jgi:Kef-type K+ transport system membrane component KefB/Trk K+ transport system NAD-binding subunit
MFNPIIQFGLVVLVVLGVSIIMRLLNQPLIIGYILSGVLVGPIFFNLIHEIETLKVLSEIGVAFLLFVVGLHLSPKVIKEVGKISLVTGIGQIVFTAVVGYFIGILLGFSKLTSLFVAIALTFSSTIIIMRILSDKDALEKLYGKVSIGFLLVQDIFHILILIVVSSLTKGSGAGDIIFYTILKGILLIGILIPISIYIVPRIGDFFAKSQEFLFIFSIAWGFGISLLFVYAGYLIEIGALIAGIMLSFSPYSFEISSKLKPLKDFFLISFFIILGSQIIFNNFSNIIFPAIVFTLLIVLGSPLIMMVLMGLFGYSKKSGFMCGLTIAQIGEFSLIFAALGVKLGYINNEIMSLLILVCLLTIFSCTYLIRYSDFIFNKLSKFLTIFEKKKIKEKEIHKRRYDYILLGYNRIGFSIIKSFSRITKNFLVIDYNPKVVKDLQKEGIHAIYGDVDDLDFLENLGLYNASVIVSTIPEKETNQLILELLKEHKSESIVLLTARQIDDALDLYKAGANYVILPHFLGGEYVSKLIENAKNNDTLYRKEKIKELELLRERLKKGHKHPQIEKDKK